jgi:large subunit ribosomal protein L18
MLSESKQRNVRRVRRKRGVRKHVRGTAQRPRMSVFKSNKNLFVQLIDDENAHTLLSASTVMKDLDTPELKKKSKEAARYIGQLIAEKAKKKKIESVIFDRGHNKYHGLLAEMASAARAAGLRF